MSISQTLAREVSSDLDVFVGFETNHETHVREGNELLLYLPQHEAFEVHQLRSLEKQSIKKDNTVQEHDFQLYVLGSLVQPLDFHLLKECISHPYFKRVERWRLCTASKNNAPTRCSTRIYLSKGGAAVNMNKERILNLRKRHSDISLVGLSLGTGLRTFESSTEILVDLQCDGDAEYENKMINYYEKISRDRPSSHR